MKIDFEKIWAEKYEAKEKTEIDRWNKIADDLSESRKTNNYEYGRKVLNTLLQEEVLNENSKVLEIGAGPGTFLIPFAAKVRKITAAEPSKGMIEKMIENAKEAGIENYEIINKKWQNVNVSKNENEYDLVIASYVLGVRVFKNIWKQLKKMEKASRKFCSVVDRTGNWNKERKNLWRKIMGDTERPDYTNLPIIYNILIEKERQPKLKTIRHTTKSSLSKAISKRKHYYNRYTEITPKIEEKIEKHLLKISDNRRVVRKEKTTIIWWASQQKSSP